MRTSHQIELPLSEPCIEVQYCFCLAENQLPTSLFLVQHCVCDVSSAQTPCFIMGIIPFRKLIEGYLHQTVSSGSVVVNFQHLRFDLIFSNLRENIHPSSIVKPTSNDAKDARQS
jgi:hypothetical protein